MCNFLFQFRFVKKYSNQKLEIQFKINRGVLKSMHIALYMISANQAQFLLFPQEETRPIRQPPLRQVQQHFLTWNVYNKVVIFLLLVLMCRPWFNKAIEKNPQQQAAVRNIVHNSSQNSLYLIFGPPGTGKTVTLVETVLQVVFFYFELQIVALMLKFILKNLNFCSIAMEATIQTNSHISLHTIELCC